MRVNRPLLKFAVVALSLAPLVLFAYLGQFSRFLSDDYMFTFIGNKLGPIGGMVYWYNSRTGSFTSDFFVSLMAPLNTVAPQVMPSLFLSVWLIGLVWLVQQGLTILQVSKYSTSISLGVSALLLTAIVNSFYSPQSLYWFNSSARYALGIGLFTIGIATAIWMARRPIHGRSFRKALLASGTLCFISAGTAEMQCGRASNHPSNSADVHC